jgi:hypothetical protein
MNTKVNLQIMLLVAVLGTGGSLQNYTVKQKQIHGLGSLRIGRDTLYPHGNLLHAAVAFKFVRSFPNYIMRLGLRLSG